MHNVKLGLSEISFEIGIQLKSNALIGINLDMKSQFKTPSIKLISTVKEF